MHRNDMLLERLICIAKYKMQDNEFIFIYQIVKHKYIRYFACSYSGKHLLNPRNL